MRLPSSEGDCLLSKTTCTWFKVQTSFPRERPCSLGPSLSVALPPSIQYLLLCRKRNANFGVRGWDQRLDLLRPDAFFYNGTELQYAAHHVRRSQRNSASRSDYKPVVDGQDWPSPIAVVGKLLHDDCLRSDSHTRREVFKFLAIASNRELGRCGIPTILYAKLRCILGTCPLGYAIRRCVMSIWSHKFLLRDDLL